MKINIYFDKRLHAETTDEEILATFENKEKAIHIIKHVRMNGSISLPVKGIPGSYVHYKKEE